MRKISCALSIIITIFTFINLPLIYNTYNNELIGRYGTQFYFDNGKEIYVVELQPKGVLK